MIPLLLVLYPTYCHFWAFQAVFNTILTQSVPKLTLFVPITQFFVRLSCGIPAGRLTDFL